MSAAEAPASATTAYRREEKAGNVSDVPTETHVVATRASGNPGPVWLTREAAERILRTVAPDTAGAILAGLDAGHTVNGPLAWYWIGTDNRPRPAQQPWEGSEALMAYPALVAR